MNYIAPVNFEEFLNRYPSLIPNMLSKRRGWLTGLDHSDIEQELYLHLMSLPEESIYRQRGCLDRISTFDPERATGNIEGLFLGYIAGIVDHFLSSRQTRNRNKVIASSIAIQSMCNESEPDSDEESLFARYARLGFMPHDSDAGLTFEDTLNAAFLIHPMVAYAGVAMAVYDTKTEACAFLRISEARLSHLLKGLRAVVENDVEVLRRFRVRRTYRARRVRSAK